MLYINKVYYYENIIDLMYEYSLLVTLRLFYFISVSL